MGWINPLSWFSGAKTSEAQGVLVRLIQQSDLTFPLSTFERMTREGFERNVTVYACVMEIARAVAGVPWCLYQVRGGRGGKVDGRRVVKLLSFAGATKAAAGGYRKAIERAEVEEHPLLKLLERPNPMQGGGAFVEMAAAFLTLHGNSYIEHAAPKAGPPRELWILRPDRVTVKVGNAKDGYIVGYAYGDNPDGPNVQLFKPEQVLHMRMFSAGDDVYGLSPLMVAARSVDSDNEAQKWNWSLLKNSGRPASAFTYEKFLGPEQVEQLRSEIRKSHAGAANAGRPMILHGGLDYKQLSLTPAEAEWLNSRKMSKLEICQAFGVPGELIGDTDHKTYQNYREARSAFYQETVLPFLDRFRDDLNNWLTPRFGEGLRLDYDKDQIEALQEDQTQLWQRVEQSTVLTINEKRAALGYDDLPNGDELLVSSALSPLDVALNPPDPAAASDVIDAELTDEGKARVKQVAEYLDVPEARAARVVRRLLISG
jgi:HK97 family phage portal protein